MAVHIIRIGENQWARNIPSRVMNGFRQTGLYPTVAVHRDILWMRFQKIILANTPGTPVHGVLPSVMI